MAVRQRGRAGVKGCWSRSRSTAKPRTVRIRGCARGQAGRGRPVRRIANAKNATPAQVALAWLLAKKPWIVPIPGTRRLKRLDENLGAVDLPLTDEDIAELDQASGRINVQGERYPEQMQAMIDR